MFLLAATSLGWTLQAQAHLAAVLVVGFFMGLGTGTNNTGELICLDGDISSRTGRLLTFDSDDIRSRPLTRPRWRRLGISKLTSPSSVHACCGSAQRSSSKGVLSIWADASSQLNLVRCIFGAVGTSVIQLMYQSALGAGWTFVLLSGICVLATPVTLIVVLRRGRAWRETRAARRRSKEAGVEG